MKKGYIYSDQMAMFGDKEIIGYGVDDFYVKEIDRKESGEGNCKYGDWGCKL